MGHARQGSKPPCDHKMLCTTCLTIAQVQDEIGLQVVGTICGMRNLGIIIAVE